MNINSVVVNSNVDTSDIDVSPYARIGEDASVGLPNLGSGGYYYGRDLIPTTAQPPVQLTPVSYPITDTYPPLVPSSALPSYQSYASYTGNVAAYPAVSSPLPSLTQSIPSYAEQTSYSSESNRQQYALAQPAVLNARQNLSVKSANGKIKQQNG